MGTRLKGGDLREAEGRVRSRDLGEVKIATGL